MNLSLLSDFFFWMMLINLGIYFFIRPRIIARPPHICAHDAFFSRP
jgi:hypothetical protein